MLTASQCEVVAAVLNGEIICLPCAKSATSSLTIEKAEQGLSHGGGDLSLLIRYELDQIVSEDAWQLAEEDADRREDEAHPDDPWVGESRLEYVDRQARDHANGYCGSCGTEL